MARGPQTPSSPAAVALVDDEGVIRRLNPAARDLLGPVEGRVCREVMAALGDSSELPCTCNCVDDLLAEGGSGQGPDDAHVRLEGRGYKLTCVAVGDRVVCLVRWAPS